MANKSGTSPSKAQKKKDAEKAAAAATGKAKAEIADRVKAKPMGPDEDYRTLATEWRERGNNVEYDTIIGEVTGPEPDKYLAYKYVWNGDEVRPEDAIAALTARLETGAVHVEASNLSAPFACSGVTGSQYGSKGGGCTVLISKGLRLEPGHAFHYRFGAVGDEEPLVLDSELWLDPLCGLAGSWLGVICGDFTQKVWNPKQRCADLSRLIALGLRLPGLRFVVKNHRTDRDGWQTIAFASGSGDDKRIATKILKKGLSIDWEGWVTEAKIENSVTGARKCADENVKKASERRHTENLATDGRRIHVYKLDAAIVGDAARTAAFTEGCAKFGALAEEPGLRKSRDKCAFAWVIYEEAKGAEAAIEGLADDMSEQFSDEGIGYLSTEYSYAADKAAMKAEVPIIKVGDDKVARRLPKEVKDADPFIAAVLAQQETAAALIKQVVAPMLTGAGTLVQKESKRLSAALGKQLTHEIKPLREVMEKQSKVIEGLMKKMIQMEKSREDGGLSSSDEHEEPVKARRRAARPATAKDEAPVSSRKPTKRDRSQGQQDTVRMEEYERLMHKITATEPGEEMVKNFMGEGFLKKYRTKSVPRAAEEETESEEDGELQGY